MNSKASKENKPNSTWKSHQIEQIRQQAREKLSEYNNDKTFYCSLNQLAPCWFSGATFCDLMQNIPICRMRK